MEENKEVVEKSLSLSELLIVARSQIAWIILIIFTCIALGVGYLVFFKKTTYTATIQMCVNARVENSEGIINETSSFQVSAYLTKNFEDAMTTNEVFALVKDSELKISKNALSFVYNEDASYSPYFQIKYSYSVHGGDEEKIKIQVATVLNDYVNKSIQHINNDENTPYFMRNSLKINSQASAGNVSASLNVMSTMMLVLVIGLAISAIFVYLKYIIDDTISTKEEIERLTGLMTVAIIDISPNETERKPLISNDSSI